MVVPPGALAHPQFPVPRDEFPRGKVQMHREPRLPEMPSRPTLIDFFKLRRAPANYVLQSAALARRNGYGNRIIMACLLHDISVHGLIRSDHGYWTAQLVEPYVHPQGRLRHPLSSGAALLPGPGCGLRVPGELPEVVWRGLHAA
jgi:hypothetical protein